MTTFKNYKRKTVVLNDGSKFRFNGHRWVNYNSKETLNDDDLAGLLSKESRVPFDEMFHAPSNKEVKTKVVQPKQKKPRKKTVKEGTQIRGVFNPKNASGPLDREKYVSELASILHCEPKELKSMNNQSSDTECIMVTSDGKAIPIYQDASWRLMGHIVEQDIRDIVNEIRSIDDSPKLLSPLKRLEKLADDYCGILHILVSAFDRTLVCGNKPEE